MSQKTLSSAVTSLSFDSGSNTLRVVSNSGTTQAVALRGVATVPAGTISMFNGSVAPSGWSLCDGSNGTPDLRNRFVYGWGAEAVRTYGGQTAYNTNTGGQHGHNVYINQTTLSESQMASHSHTPAGGYQGWPDKGYIVDSGVGFEYLTTWPDFAPRGNQRAMSYNGGYDSHYHGGYSSYDNGHFHSVNVVPPYYRIAFIMKL